MTPAEKEFTEAFKRLKSGKPIRVKKYSLIDLNMVALEAGKKAGSLRRVRYPDLCKEIDAYDKPEKQEQKDKRLKEQYHSEKAEYENLWHQTLARELMLIKRVGELEKTLRSIKQKYPGVLFDLDDMN
ncbi:MAG TPA: hypothetical protein PLM93_09950 [Sulfuricurvum sp.]|nr:MAG: hypothetical protein B7Y30_03600 [Campylobacterales bacterium 16-40-21]OZA02595.1 MAG: hypothetical protein B7X89_08630 [Sulfuricurvum sp. 17-40-25]HQS67491.1 hypothetical protein [Sulfuricurvum sp.]HQT36331.1 hypothetical protein [Sulfuricurvum sp.]